MKSLQEYIQESCAPSKRARTIQALKTLCTPRKPKKFPSDFWINDSDNGKGEDHEVIKMGYNDGNFGVWVAPDNAFYPMSDLSDKEIDDLAGHLSNSLSRK